MCYLDAMCMVFLVQIIKYLKVFKYLLIMQSMKDPNCMYLQFKYIQTAKAMGILNNQTGTEPQT